MIKGLINWEERNQPKKRRLGVFLPVLSGG